MIKVIGLSGYESAGDLAQKINELVNIVKDQKDFVKVVDIKYQYGDGLHSALIICEAVDKQVVVWLYKIMIKNILPYLTVAGIYITWVTVAVGVIMVIEKTPWMLFVFIPALILTVRNHFKERHLI